MAGRGKAARPGRIGARRSFTIRTCVAGRWETLKDFPHLQYQHNTVKNPREEHRAWDGKIIKTDDPWWQTHYPPNGWGCRCTVTGVSEARLRALGKTAPDTAPGPSAGDPPPEWAYHVGEASSGRKVDARILEAERGGKMSAMGGGDPADFGRPERVPLDVPRASAMAPGDSAESIRAMFEHVAGGKAMTVTDPTGAIVEVNGAIVDHWLEDAKRTGRERYLPFLQETIEDPFEIWVGFARNELTGKVYLRRRYVKALQLDKGKYVSVVFDAIGGQWLSYNAFFGNSTSKGQRAGRLLWGR